MVSNRPSLSGHAPGATSDSTGRASLSAREVHDRLRAALTELTRAERNAVLWFSEIVRRKLYRELGYASIHQYAELALGWKKGKTSQFLRLSESLKELPGLRRSVARGELSWTKAREVAKVATPGTEAAWIQAAKETSSRALEAKVKASRERARAAGSSARGQGELVGVEVCSGPVSGGSGPSGLGIPNTTLGSSPSGSSSSATVQTSAPAVPRDIHFRMTPEQYARYQALIEAIRKNRRREGRTELMLAALEQLALCGGEGDAPGDGGGARDNGLRAVRSRSEKAAAGRPEDPRKFTRVNSTNRPEGRSEFTRVNSRSPYQVIVQQCPDCGSGRVATNRGDRKLTPQELRAILCDAHRRAPGKKNQAAVPGRLRRAVVERDRFRCRSAGCGGTAFLAVHHLVPRERGGRNTLENLITLCSPCHRALHTHE